MHHYLSTICLSDQDVNKLFRTLGICVQNMENGHASLCMPVTPLLAQGVGLVGGGILATLADECMAHAVMSLLQGKAVTIEMNIRYLHGVKADHPNTLYAEASVVKQGKTILSAEARLTNEVGSLLATAGASFYALRD